MTLQSELDAFRAAWEARVGPDAARLIETDIEALRATGLVERAARPGTRLPRAGDLRDPHGAPFDLEALVARSPLVLTFYRGGWCPYCNLELRAWQARLAELRGLGAELVAVSPELPDHALSTAQKSELAFTVLSDVGGGLAAALGVRFALSEAVRPYYERAGHALPARHGDGGWWLPVPATFVVARGGTILAAFVEPDYRKRLEPEAALATLRDHRLAA
jgi:peroxiredoxin